MTDPLITVPLTKAGLAVFTTCLSALSDDAQTVTPVLRDPEVIADAVGEANKTKSAEKTTKKEPAKRGRKPKSAAPVEETSAPEDVSEEYLGMGEEEEVLGLATPTYSKEDVIAKFRSVVEGTPARKPELIAVLQKFGVKSVHDLKPEQYTAVMASF